MTQQGLKAGDKVAVYGFGGLGHLAVKFAVAFGCEVTVISRTAAKESAAKAMGASRFILSTDAEAMKAAAGSLSFILDTASYAHDIHGLLDLLAFDGTLCFVGMPPQTDLYHFQVLPTVMGRKHMVSSFMGGIQEAKDMLKFCAEKKILPDIDLIKASYLNEAWQRMDKSDVRFRFVLDCESI
eukprot:NODE_3884_length_900_cov_24.159812_g3575_i0.p1 GENE.NODE_3884_length_900_cov_24.159812_g3575_i0~~NODE_3884_length_900_cov_24.159812_g3575_i0.p1  ORF type:complete len:199 (-),score=42.35 NODE_3884_length_900_cov_24.159812_g3575_i0:302-850(-)